MGMKFLSLCDQINFHYVSLRVKLIWLRFKIFVSDEMSAENCRKYSMEESMGMWISGAWKHHWIHRRCHFWYVFTIEVDCCLYVYRRDTVRLSPSETSKDGARERRRTKLEKVGWCTSVEIKNLYFVPSKNKPGREKDFFWLCKWTSHVTTFHWCDCCNHAWTFEWNESVLPSPHRKKLAGRKTAMPFLIMQGMWILIKTKVQQCCCWKWIHASRSMQFHGTM